MACKGGDDIPTNRPAQKDPFKETFHEAILEKMKNNYDVSAGLFEKCLSMRPENDAVHYALSDVYELMGQKNKSLQYALSAFELDKENKWYQKRCGDLYFDKGDYHKAAEYYAMSIEDEKNIDLKFRYAESLIFSNQFKPAIAILDEIEVEVGFSPHLTLTKHDMYLKLGDEKSAQAELDKLITDDPTNIENRLIVADYFLQTNQLDKGQQAILQALAIDSLHGEAHMMLAGVYIRKGDLKGGFEQLEKGFQSAEVPIANKIGFMSTLQQYAFDGSPDGKIIQEGLGNLYEQIYDEELENDTLHMQYGYFLQGSGQPQKAIEQFEKALEINGDNFQNWLQLMYAQLDIEDYDRMYASSQKAVELFPSQPTVFLLGGMAAYESEHYETAEEWLFYGKDLVVNDNALQAEFQHQLGVLSWKQKEYDQAYFYFSEALRYDNYNGNVYESKALCLQEEGKHKEAMEVVQSALDQAPTNAFFLNLKGTVLAREGQFSAAIQAYENALVYEPNNPKILENYGDALFQNGQEEKAIKKWQEAVDKGGYNVLLIKKLNDKKYYAQ